MLWRGVKQQAHVRDVQQQPAVRSAPLWGYYTPTPPHYCMAWNDRLTHVTGGNNIREPFRGEPSGEEFFHIHDDHAVLVHQRAEEVRDVDVAEDVFQLRAHGDVGVFEQSAYGHLGEQ